MTEVFSKDPDLCAEEFLTDELVAIARPDHALLAGKRITARRFCDEPFVARETGPDTKSFAERALAARGLFPKPAMRLGTTEAIKRAVAAGVGVALVSRLSLGLELKAKTLAIVPLTDLRLTRPLFCITRAGRNSPPALTAFLDMLRAAIVQPPARHTKKTH